MGNEEKETVYIVSIVDEGPPGRGPRGPHGRFFSEKVAEIPLATFQVNVNKFIDAVHSILSEAKTISGEFSMDTVEISAEITAEGSVGFLGTGGRLTGEGGLKMIFNRVKQD